MPKRKKPEEKPDEQFELFVETARKLEIDDTSKPLDEAFKKLSVRRDDTEMKKAKKSNP